MGIYRGGYGEGAPEMMPMLTAELEGLGDLERWVFHEQWDSTKEPPPLLQAWSSGGESSFGSRKALPLPGQQQVVVIEQPSGRKTAEQLEKEAEAKREAEKARIPLERVDLCLTQSDLMRLNLRLLMRKRTIILHFARRCPSMTALEFEALYEHHVLVMSAPPYVKQHPSLLESRQRQLELSDAWCAREEVMRRCEAQQVLLERAATIAMHTADARLEAKYEEHTSMSSSVRPQSAKTTSSSAAAGGGDDDVVKPPVSAVSAMIRSAITIAQNSRVRPQRRRAAQGIASFTARRLT